MLAKRTKVESKTGGTHIGHWVVGT